MSSEVQESLEEVEGIFSQ